MRACFVNSENTANQNWFLTYRMISSLQVGRFPFLQCFCKNAAFHCGSRRTKTISILVGLAFSSLHFIETHRQR